MRRGSKEALVFGWRHLLGFTRTVVVESPHCQFHGTCFDRRNRDGEMLGGDIQIFGRNSTALHCFPLIIHTHHVWHPMTSYQSLRGLCTYIALFCLYAQAQVTGEGGPALGATETSPPVTKTAALASGPPTNYYSSVHPHITLPRCVALSGLCELIWTLHLV